MNPSLPDDLDAGVLDRYITGRSLPGESEAVARWLAADSSRQAALHAVRGQLREAPAFDVEAMLGRVNARIDRAQRRREPPSYGTAWSGVGRRRWWVAAAAMVALLGSGMIVLYGTMGRAVNTASEATPTVFATGRGERRAITLSDGTRILLAPLSRLAVYSTYGRELRMVDLTGQAMFTVQHDVERPFRVRTPMGVAEDLGTEFDVRAYPGDDIERVVVASGTVLFRAASDAATAAVLQRDQMGWLSRDGTVQVERDIDAHTLLGWVRGELVFDDAPLEQVAADLSRWYDVDIRLNDARVRNERFTATFRQSSLDHVLAVVAKALDLHVVRLPARQGAATLPKIVLQSGRPH